MKTLKHLTYWIITLLLIQGCKPAFQHQVTILELQDLIEFLASDSLKGRYPGTLEDSVLTSFIVEKFDESGMELLDEDGMQPVEVETGYIVTGNNRIKLDGRSLNITGESGLQVLGFSASESVRAEVILAASVPGEASNEIKGNILMVPVPEKLSSSPYDAYRSLRSKALKASDLGFSAIIFVHRQPLPDFNSEKRLPLSIPVLAFQGDPASALIQFESSDALFDIIASYDDIAVSTGINVIIETEVLPKTVETHNTLAYLSGSDRHLSGQSIIIGAHHDHLGTGGRGSSSRRQDTIGVHPGADDNASGVAGVIELSQHLMSRSPSRSFVFTTFAAEEMGLNGSRAFVEKPPVPLDSIQAMINLDMLGRLNDQRQLQIGGVGTSPVFRKLIDSANLSYNFNIAMSEAGYGPSDHSSFYAEDIPVLFITTGAHPDYHTPMDIPGKISYTGLEEVLNFVSDLAYIISEYPEKIEFTMAGPKESSGSRGRQGIITFGLMPDVMYDGNEGMPVSFVTEGKPASIGGMKAGDIIIAVDSKSIGNVYDYMDRLSDLREGQSVVVTVKREDKTLDLLLKL